MDNKTFHAKMKWNPYINKWRMTDPVLGTFIENYEDCMNFRRMFPGLNKDKITLVQLNPAVKIKDEDNGQ